VWEIAPQTGKHAAASLFNVNPQEKA